MSITRIIISVLIALLALTASAQAQQFAGYPPAGDVQIANGPAGPPTWVPNPAALKANNLSDLLDAPTARSNLGLGSMAVQNANAVAISGGNITGLPPPVSGADAATKTYVDSAAAGLFPHAAVRLVTVAALPTNTYSNGAAGVGATLTGSANAALSVDGVAVAAADRILVTQEFASIHNGIYVVTAPGSGGSPYVLTRSSDANTIGPGGNSISAGTYVFVQGGTTLANTAWVQGASLTALGTSPLVWTLFAAGAVSQVNGLTGPVNIVGNTGIQVTTTPGLISLSLVPFGYLGGLTLSNDATANTVLDIGAGTAADSTNATLISIGAFKKSISGAWVAGSNNAGMGTGLTATASTWYHVCLANNSGSPDIWFDTSATCTHRPAGISDPLYRRIGAMRLNSSTIWMPFAQNGDYFMTNASSVFGPTGSSVTLLTGIITPPGVITQALLAWDITVTLGSATLGYAAGSNLNMGTSFASVANNNSGTTGNFGTVVGPPTDLASRISLSSSVAGPPGTVASLQVWSIGWIDTRGK